jgi:hypothetical protein
LRESKILQFPGIQRAGTGRVLARQTKEYVVWLPRDDF